LDAAPAIKSVDLPTGVTLPYVEQGDPFGVALLLVPGFLDTWRSFELVLPHIPEAVHTIALTQRGHGDASKPATGYRYAQFASDLAGFMDAVGVEAAVVGGHSASGLIAQRFAIDHPQRTLGIALIGSPMSLAGMPALQELWDSTLSNLQDPIDPAFVRDVQRSAVVRPVPEAFFETLVEEALKVPAHVWRAGFEGFLEDDFSGELAKIHAPTLLLWGDQDEVVTRDQQDALLEAIEGSRLVVFPGVGHSPHWEIPDRFTFEVTAFIEGLRV
jgi:non-heme chloroperoxidase